MSGDKARSNNFAFTDFVCDPSFWDEFIEKKKPKFVIAGHEICPTSGRKHFQGFINFENARYVSAIQKALKGRHVEACFASPWANIKYCEKDGNIAFQYGMKPEQGKRTDLADVCDMVKQGCGPKEIAEAHPVLWIRYAKGIQNLMEKVNPQPKRNWKTEVYYVYGPIGTGKTKLATQDGGEIISFENGFMLGYDNQEIVIFDDFEGFEFKRGMILKLLDRYAMKVNVKGGEKEWNPKRIWITSNFDIETLPFGNTKAAFVRRLDHIWKYEKNGIEDETSKTWAKYQVNEDRIKDNCVAPINNQSEDYYSDDGDN